jgi:hypothetical protein
MRRFFSTVDLQAVSSVLAMVLLLSSIPLTSGVLIVSGPSHPVFTINICQPIQTLNHASNTIVARPLLKAPQFDLFSSGPLISMPIVRIVDYYVTPETPPPKPLS